MNIEQCKIEKKIEDKSFGYVYCFLKLRDNNTILCGCANSGVFCFYDINENKITKNINVDSLSKSNHFSYISALLLIDDNTFLSCSNDDIIRVWKY